MGRKITTAFFLFSMLFLHLGGSWHISEPEPELCSCDDEAPPPPPATTKAPPPPPATAEAPPPPPASTEAPPPPTSTPGDGTTEGSLEPEDCYPHCANRCSKSKTEHSMHTCIFHCLQCCAKCFCVPAGTYGNKHTCPCYDNWKTEKGDPKCP